MSISSLLVVRDNNIVPSTSGPNSRVYFIPHLFNSLLRTFVFSGNRCLNSIDIAVLITKNSDDSVEVCHRWHPIEGAGDIGLLEGSRCGREETRGRFHFFLRNAVRSSDLTDAESISNRCQ